MNNKEFKIYVNELKKTFEVPITQDLIEKDYILSLFLSNWAKTDTPSLDKLIFKGGTLLTKNYLKYHRISEDLDFTHEESNKIRILGKNKRDRKVKSLVQPIIDEVKIITDLSKLNFEIERTNSRYIFQRNSRSLYVFNLYYKSQFSSKEQLIKLEISFVEDLINTCSTLDINNIVDFHISSKDSAFFKITNYDIIKPSMLTYSVEEIILEKIRATITREQFKPRDVFDLYLINKDNNVFKQSKDEIFRKLNASPFAFDIINGNIKNFIKEEITIDLEDIYNLSLIKFNENEFNDFANKLIKYLKQISEEFIKD